MKTLWMKHKNGLQAMVTLVEPEILRVTYLPKSVKPQEPTLGVSHTQAHHHKKPVQLIVSETSEINETKLGDFRIVMSLSGDQVRIYYRGRLVSDDSNFRFDHPEMTYNRLQATAVFGLGEKYEWMNRIETVTTDWCSDVIGFVQLHHSLFKEYHTAMPFHQTILEGQVVGRYFDNTWRTSFDFDRLRTGAFHFRAEGGQLDSYLMMGTTVQDVTRLYGKLTGFMPLPRMDFLGYQQCRYSYMTEDEVIAVAEGFRKYDIPCDVLYLDIDYMDAYKVFTHDRDRFGNIGAMNQHLKSLGIKTVAIVDPGVKVEKGYDLYDEGLAKQYFVTEGGKAPHKPYVGKVWPGDSVYPDFLRQEVRDWWGTHHQKLIDMGIDGIWNDMNEPSDMSTPEKTLPEDCLHQNDRGETITHAEAHNIYALFEAKSTYEAMKRLQSSQDLRPFLLTRAAFSGTQRYSALWTGDNSSVWEHLEASIPMLVNLGLTGYAYTGGDVGGFMNDSNGELLTRWTQMGAFMPLFRNHSAVGTLNQEPWQFGQVVMSNVRDAIRLRYRFMTYLYTQMWQASTLGDPIMRPLFYDNQDRKAMGIQDQFLFGSDVLVAPVYRPGVVERLVYLPEGKWMCYKTDAIFEGGKSIIAQAPVDTIPLYVRVGTILPQDPERSYIDGPTATLDLHLFGGTTGETTLYFDDGMTFAYEQGASATLRVKFILDDDVVILYKDITGDFKIPSLKVILHGALRGREIIWA